MLRYLGYLIQSLRFWSIRDYLDMSYGIMARYARCRPYWDRHLRLCKDFQRLVLGEPRKRSSLTVLGAGACLDLDLEYLARFFSRIVLVDINPSLRSSWQKLAEQYPEVTFDFVFLDLTGLMSKWTLALKRALRRGQITNLQDLRAFVDTLLDSQIDVPISSTDVVISLNILSQLPVYWRDRVVGLFRRYAKQFLDDYGVLVEEVEELLQESFGFLQSEHLSLIFRLKPKQVVLIFDDEFYFYTQDESEWVVEEAQFSDFLPPPDYQLEHSTAWFWHLAPQGVELEDYGVIHRVRGLVFNKIYQ